MALLSSSLSNTGFRDLPLDRTGFSYLVYAPTLACMQNHGIGGL